MRALLEQHGKADLLIWELMEFSPIRRGSGHPECPSEFEMVALRGLDTYQGQA